jgi:uncharacterized protein with GYD domain
MQQSQGETTTEAEMPKYLIEAKYVGTGIEGLLKEGGTSRRAAIDQLFLSLGGSVECFYYAFGEHDVILIGELPDNATTAALALKINASGAAYCRTVVLMTTQEIDEAVRKTAMYRPPGASADENEVAKWDSEGGHLATVPV